MSDRAEGCIQDLAGSIINKSAFFHRDKYFHRKSSTFAFTKSIFFKLFNFAFFSQSKLADLTTSTETTFFAQYFAKIIHIVAVHPYKSKTICSFKSFCFTKSKTIEYSFSAQVEFV
jgi:hypothetical protein